jgi:hypothetical protein
LRVDLGPAAADVLFLLAGFGLLNAIGLLRASFADSLAAIGLAFLTGVSFITVVAIALLTAGAPFRLPGFVGLCLITAVIGLLVRREWLRSLRLPRPPTRFGKLRFLVRGLRPPQRWISAVSLAAFAVYAITLILAASVRPLVEWDSWSIWSRKAEILFFSGSLPTDFFASSAYVFMHPDYPILIPVFESIQYRAMGTIDTQAIHAQFWVLLVMFVWGMLYLGLRRGTVIEWLPIVLAVSIAPAVYSQLLTAYADIPMALLLALGVFLLGEWLETRDGRLLALSVLFLAASANTKNEGLMGAVVALGVAAVLTAAHARRDAWKPLALGAAAFIAGILPWRLWISVEGIHGDIPALKGLNPSYLADRADRIWPSVQSLYGQLVDQTGWLYVVPLGLALTLVCLFVRGRRTIAAFYLATGLIAFVVLIWVYWISPTVPLGTYLALSSYRVVATLTAISLAAFLQLAAPVSVPGKGR